MALQQVLSRLRPSSEPPINTLVRPFQRFAHEEASGGIVLLACTIAALLWVNLGFEHSYETVWDTHLAIGFSSFLLDKPIHLWINDALMAIFFFVVGLEIKRSILVGELASIRRAALPVFAAIGGMIVPAAIYFALNSSGEEARGWGIPMATDIAFSLGVLALLGTRAPMSLKIFLTAFAIVDDIGAIIVIAIFYTESILWLNLAIGGGLILLLGLFNRIGIRTPLIYALIGVVIWVFFLKSGVHPTIAGVLIAMTIPLKVLINPDQFVAKGRSLLDEFERDGELGPRRGDLALTTVRQRAALEELENSSKHVESPLQRLEHSLHPWVAFAIIPIFALSNAGVAIDAKVFSIFSQPVALGIILGLLIGKPIGVTLFSWIAIRVGVAAMPLGVTWTQILGVSFLGGIGFTVSIFITGLAFSSDSLVTDAKIGILIASILAGAIGYVLLRRSTPEITRQSGDEQHGAH